MTIRPWEWLTLKQLGRLHQIYGAVFVLAGLLELGSGLAAWWWAWGNDGSELAWILLAGIVITGVGAATAGAIHGWAGAHIRKGYNMRPAVVSCVLATLVGGPLGVFLTLLTLVIVRGNKTLFPEEDEEPLPDPDPQMSF